MGMVISIGNTGKAAKAAPDEGNMNELERKEVRGAVERVTGIDGGRKYAVLHEAGEGYELYDGRTRRNVADLPEGAETFHVLKR